MGPLDSKEEAEGAALETLFLQSLSAINDYFRLDYKYPFLANIWRATRLTLLSMAPEGFMHLK